MRRNTTQLDSLSIGFGGTQTMHLPVGAIIDETVIETNVPTAQILSLDVVLNGETLSSVPASFYKMLEAYKGTPSPDAPVNRIVIPFYDATSETQDGQNITALVTHPTDNLLLRVKLAAATQAQIDAGTVPEFNGYIKQRPRAQMADKTLEKRAYLKKITRLDINAPIVGEAAFTTFDKGPRIQRMHFGDGHVTELKIMHNSLKRFDLKASQNNEELKRSLTRRVPQTNWFHFDPCASGFNMMDALQTAGASFEIRPTVDQAGAIPTYIETIETAK